MRLATRVLLARRGLCGTAGVEAVEVVVAKGFEGCGVFADEGVGFGEDAVLEGVEAGCGLAFRGSGSGGFECVEAVGLDLFDRCHRSYSRLGG